MIFLRWETDVQPVQHNHLDWMMWLFCNVKVWKSRGGAFHSLIFAVYVKIQVSNQRSEKYFFMQILRDLQVVFFKISSNVKLTYVHVWNTYVHEEWQEMQRKDCRGRDGPYEPPSQFCLFFKTCYLISGQHSWCWLTWYSCHPESKINVHSYAFLNDLCW